MCVRIFVYKRSIIESLKLKKEELASQTGIFDIEFRSTITKTKTNNDLNMMKQHIEEQQTPQTPQTIEPSQNL